MSNYFVQSVTHITAPRYVGTAPSAGGIPTADVWPDETGGSCFRFQDPAVARALAAEIVKAAEALEAAAEGGGS